MGEIKAIAFDLDHTLYDRNATWDRLWPAFRRIYAFDIFPDVTNERLLNALKAADFQATYGETSWRGMYEELVAGGIITGASGFTFFNSFIYEFFPGAIVPFADTYRVLAWCRREGLHPSVITNGHTGLQERKLAAMELMPYLDECIICNLDSGTGCKPEPMAFLELAGRLKLRPERILYVGDNPRNDVTGAKSAGMQTAWLNVMNNWNTAYAPADFEISSLSEVREIVGRK